MHTDNPDFDRGVAWGIFLSTFDDLTDPSADSMRLAVLTTLVDALDAGVVTNADDVRYFLSTAQQHYECHGTLSPGKTCTSCGAVNHQEVRA